MSTTWTEITPEQRQQDRDTLEEIGVGAVLELIAQLDDPLRRAGNGWPAGRAEQAEWLSGLADELDTDEGKRAFLGAAHSQLRHQARKRKEASR